MFRDSLCKYLSSESVAVVEQDNRFHIDGKMLEEIDSMASQ